MIFWGDVIKAEGGRLKAEGGKKAED